jgi:hypothetical protein
MTRRSGQNAVVVHAVKQALGLVEHARQHLVRAMRASHHDHGVLQPNTRHGQPYLPPSALAAKSSDQLVSTSQLDAAVFDLRRTIKETDSRVGTLID